MQIKQNTVRSKTCTSSCKGSPQSKITEIMLLSWLNVGVMTAAMSTLYTHNQVHGCRSVSPIKPEMKASVYLILLTYVQAY